MLTLREFMSIVIFAIACFETVRNVETINTRRENSEVRMNLTSKVRNRNEAGIFGEHIKRWDYFKDTRKIWLWPRGIIPFVISDGFSSAEKLFILKTIDEFNKKTCVKFESREKQRDYVEFQKSYRGCWAFIGKLRGRNLVELDFSCLTRPTDLMHQLMHVLGFYDQHNTPGRDKWIKISWDNIQSDKKSYFEIGKARTMNAQLPYDLNSLMHLRGNFFAKDSFHHTMYPMYRFEKMGPLNDDFNKRDIHKINTLYVNECEFWQIEPRVWESGHSNTSYSSPADNEDYTSADTAMLSGYNENGNNFVTEVPDENPSDYEKLTPSMTEQTGPRMVCVFWPATYGESNSLETEKNYEKRHNVDKLPNIRVLKLNNYKKA